MRRFASRSNQFTLTALFLLAFTGACFAQLGQPDPAVNTNPQAVTTPSPGNIPKAYPAGKVDSGFPGIFQPGSLQAALNAGNTQINGAISLKENTTAPSTSELWISAGNSITLGNFNLTIKGPFHGSPGCFVQNGKGTVIFGPGAIKALNPRWFGVKGDGVTDDGPALMQVANCIQASGSGAVGTISFPKANYHVFTGSSYVSPFQLNGISGINIEGNWSTLSIDATNTYYDTTPHSAVIFWLHGCSNISVNHFNVTGPRFNCAQSSYSGIAFVWMDRGGSGLSMPHNVMNGGGLALALGTTGDTQVFNDVDVGILDVSNVCYGITGQMLGRNLRVGILKTSYVYRSMFLVSKIAPMQNVQAIIDSTNPQGFVDCYFKQFNGCGITDLDIKYISGITSTAVGTNTRVVLVFEGTTPIAARNIKFNFDVDFAASGATGYQLFSVYKLVNDTTEDTTERGHSLTNLYLTGSVTGTPSVPNGILIGCGSPSAAHGTWGTGEYWSNIKLENLNVDNACPIQFMVDSIVDNASLINVQHPLGVISFCNGATATSWLTNGKVISIGSNYLNQYAAGGTAPPMMVKIPFPTGSPLNIPANWTDQPITNDRMGSRPCVFKLPASVPGMRYVFVASGRGVLSISPNRTDIISGRTPGQSLVFGTAGGTVTLQCVTAGTWEIVNGYGDFE